MRVALVHNDYAAGVPSGETAVAEEEERALRRAGVTVARFGTSADAIRRLPLGTLRAGLAWATATGVRVVHPLAGLGEFAPDVIHVHNTFPGIGQRWTGDVDVPLVHTLHNLRHFCAAATLTRDLQPCRLCIDGSRWNAARFGCYRGSRAASVPFALAPSARRAPLLRNASCLIALNRVMRDELVRAGHGDRTLLEPANFLPDRHDVAVACGDGARGDHWLYVGRLAAEKGIVALLRRWPTGVRVRVVGGGEEDDEVAAIAAARPEVTHLGVLPRAEVLEELRSCRGVVMPSLWPEGMPVVYVEAMATDTPVAAVVGSAPGDLVRTQGTGWAFESVAAMAAGLADVTDPPAGTCRAAFEAHYTESAFLARRLGLYERLLAGDGPS